MSNHKGVQTHHQQGRIESLAGPDRYQNASEVLRDGLPLAEPYDVEDAAKLDALRQAAAIGWRDLDTGHYRDVGEDALTDYIGQLGARASNSSALKADDHPSRWGHEVVVANPLSSARPDLTGFGRILQEASASPVRKRFIVIQLLERALSVTTSKRQSALAGFGRIWPDT